MASFFGAILQFFGLLLNAIYRVIPSYGVAIILLTVLVRLVLYPLAVKQIRSMTAMQKIQPKMKELQKKHKGDRQKLNEEMMKLYKEHGVNPLGGCFPMLLQLPVFIALYAVIRTGVPFAVAVQPVQLPFAVPKAISCHVSQPGDTNKDLSHLRPTVTLDCRGSSGASETISNVNVTNATINKGSEKGQQFSGLPAYVTQCTIPAITSTKDAKGNAVTTLQQLTCASPLGSGHLPRTGKLMDALVHDKATFLGMHLACTPTQANTKKSIQLCTTAENAGGGFALIGYYLLVALMVVTTWYQQKQMIARQKGQQSTPQQQQMQMMSKIMPVFMGFISLNFPAALSLYWVVGNVWMIGQQHLILTAQDDAPGATTAPSGPVKGTTAAKQAPATRPPPRVRRQGKRRK
jgi:YidC/Oxa1 family membrane protein insertase